MAKRSLQLSAWGQQQARQALLYKSLTQKAIATELLIASWATVNKFFNGKAVDRFIFQEICEALDLDWQQVVQSPDVPSDTNHPEESQAEETQATQTVASSPLLDAVRTQATAAREALTPRILERIPRQVVRDKYLQAIARGTTQERSRVISIIGPAGYGKSTILGDIYDELIEAKTPWVGLVLCSSLSLSTGYLGYMSYGFVAATMAPTMGVGATGPFQSQHDMVDSSIGLSLCGESRSVVALARLGVARIAAELNQQQGRGVLLIDTLDLVVNQDFVVILGALLRQLLSNGTTVVFTCRDYEYNDYLEPINQRLPGLTRSIDRFTVPNFTTAEIRAAAHAFFKTLAPNQPERGQAFADNILALSTDNRSLRDILENPLLLALLCDLFAADGTVPPDLTVSKLYQRYWQEKVAYSRADQSQFAPLAIEKETLCLGIAQRLFDLSQTRLYESFYRDDLGIELTPGAIAAYNDLLSEGVLTQLASGKLHFFHQTLLEYAIAYWLTRHAARAQLEHMLGQLQSSSRSQDGTYWLPVLRQLLAIVDDDEFERLIAALDIEQMGIFGAIAYAAVSRDRPDALRRLLPTALHLGETHQKRLRQALAAAPRHLIEQTWDVLLILIRDSEHVTASNTVQMVGALLERWWSSLSDRLEETLEAIAARPLETELSPPNSDDRGRLLGWLLQPCQSLIQSSSHPGVLSALRQQTHLMGHGTLAGVIQSHAQASPADQHDLLQRLLQAPVPRYEDVKQALIDFVARLLPQHLELKTFPLGHTWSEVLHREYPDQWHSIQIHAIGRWIAHDQSVFQELLLDYLHGSAERMGRSLKALLEGLYEGAGHWILPIVQTLELDTVTVTVLERLSKLLPRSTADYLSVETQEQLVQWLHPYLEAYPNEVCPLLNVFADASSTARKLLPSALDALDPDLKHLISLQLLRFQPIETHPSLIGMKKADQRFLISIYQQQADENPVALSRLLDIAQGNNRDAAIAASQSICQVREGELDPTQLLPLLRSRFVGVRVSALEAIAQRSTQTPIAASVVTQLCECLEDEKSPIVTRYFFNLVTDWVRLRHAVPPIVPETIARLLKRVIAADQLEGGIGRSLVAVLKVILRSEVSTLDPKLLSQTVHQLITGLHFIQIKNGESEVIDVLCGVHRLNPSFLQEAVEQDWPTLSQRQWLRNCSTLIKAIRKLEGPQAPLLDVIMQRYGDESDIASLVLEARGG